MAVSAFSYGHNLIESGYPIIEAIAAVQDYVDEIVIADCQSTDSTRWVLQKLGVRVIDGLWGNEAGETLKQAHLLHCQCEHDIIIHFEADEVFSDSLIREVRKQIDMGWRQIYVYRLQLEQNFQRCRWYPEPVHRIFQRGTVTKEGHTTNFRGIINAIGMTYGYLWDITNCFRDNWLTRVNNQAKLWHNSQPGYIHTPLHFKHSTLIDNLDKFLQQQLWHYKSTPFDIPDILKPLLGCLRYEDSVNYKRLME